MQKKEEEKNVSKLERKAIKKIYTVVCVSVQEYHGYKINFPWQQKRKKDKGVWKLQKNEIVLAVSNGAYTLGGDCCYACMYL